MFLREYWREKIWKYFRNVLTRSLVGCLRREHMKYWMSKVSFDPWNQMKKHFRFYWEGSKLPHRIKEMTKTCVGGDGLGGYRGNQGRLKRECQRCQGWVSPCAYARTLRYCSGWSGPCQTSGWYCRKIRQFISFISCITVGCRVGEYTWHADYRNDSTRYVQAVLCLQIAFTFTFIRYYKCLF